MATVVISFNGPEKLDTRECAQICSIYYPNNAAADLAPFEGTYYDTNVEGFGEGMSLERFMASQVAYPKLHAYLREAIRNSRYEFTTTDENFLLFLKESAPALVDQGFKIEIA